MVKESQLRAKVETPMREKLEVLARKRGETLAVLVREAIYDFLRAHDAELSENGSQPRKKPVK